MDDLFVTRSAGGGGGGGGSSGGSVASLGDDGHASLGQQQHGVFSPFGSPALFGSGGSTASSPMPLNFAASPSFAPSRCPSSGSGGSVASPGLFPSGSGVYSGVFPSSGAGGHRAFPSSNIALFPHLAAAGGGEDAFGFTSWALPQSPTPFALPGAHPHLAFDEMPPSAAAAYASPSFASMQPRSPGPTPQSPDAFSSLGQLLGGAEEDLARDMSFSQEDAPHYPIDENPLETDSSAWEEPPEADLSTATDLVDITDDGADHSAEDEGMTSSKRRKFSGFKPIPAPSVAPRELPQFPPASARVCELGLLNRQVTGHLCWTAYQKLSATDRSCLALLCAAHSDEAASASAGCQKYTQFVPTELLLQLGLTIERKPLERILLKLQAERKIEPVLVMRIRRAVPGRVKTGPEFAQLLLFTTVASRLVAEQTLAAHLPPPESRIGFPAALVPFSCDFTKRCVWLVPKQLCVGGQYMLPAEAGQLPPPPSPAAAPIPPPSAISTVAMAPSSPATHARLHSHAHATIPQMPSSPGAHSMSQSIVPSQSGGPPGVSASAAGPVTTSIPLFSALSLHAPPSLEDATYGRVIAAAKGMPHATAAAPGADPYPHLQLGFTDMERNAVAAFKRFPSREPIFADEAQPVDLFVSRQTFLQCALEVLLDLTWPNDADRQAEQIKWAPLLHSLFLVINLPTAGTHASAVTFTQFLRLYAWLRPDAGWTKPKPLDAAAEDDEADGEGWTPADLAVDPATHRSVRSTFVTTQTHKLLLFVHRSLKFFQAYVRTPLKAVFATRAQLEADERFKTIDSPSSPAEAEASMDAASPSADLLFLAQIRLCDGLTDEPSFRDIMLSYTWRRATDLPDAVHPMEHVPLLQDGDEGFVVLQPHTREPAVSLNFLSAAGSPDTALVDLARSMHEQRELQPETKREIKMEGDSD